MKEKSMKSNITFQLEPEDAQKLKKLAEKDNRSIASFLRNLVLDLIKKNEDEIRKS